MNKAIKRIQEASDNRYCDDQLISSDGVLWEDIQFLLAENMKLRKIASHVPGKIYIEAKESAGFGDVISTVDTNG